MTEKPVGITFEIKPEIEGEFTLTLQQLFILQTSSYLTLPWLSRKGLGPCKGKGYNITSACQTVPHGPSGECNQLREGSWRDTGCKASDRGNQQDDALKNEVERVRS